ALSGCGRRFVRTEFFVSARIARTKNGRGHGRKSGDRRRGCWLGDESCEKTGLGKDDAECDAHYRTESRGVSRRLRRRERDQYDPPCDECKSRNVTTET